MRKERYLNRIAALVLTALLTAALPVSFVCAAGNNHGQDARSQSMSVDTGDEPITDMSVTQDPGADKGAGVLGELFGWTLPDIPWKTAGIAAGVLVLLIVVIKIIRAAAASSAPSEKQQRKQRKKRDKGYTPKH